MQRWPVESSQIASVGYDPAKQVLEIEFKRGNAVYHYAQVSSEVYEELMAAKSVGKFFNAEIRDKFLYHRLEPEVTIPTCQHEGCTTETNLSGVFCVYHAAQPENAVREAEARKASGPQEDESTPRTAHPDSGFSEA